MASLVSCDDCGKTNEGPKCPHGWFDIELSLKQNLRAKDFTFLLCPDCYEKIVSPTSLGFLKRVLSLFKGKKK